MDYAVDPDAVQMLATRWDDAAGGLGAARRLLPDEAIGGDGDPAGAVADLVQRARHSLVGAAAAAIEAADDLRIVATAYRSADAVLDRAGGLSPPAG